jgi:hypothetical protein
MPYHGMTYLSLPPKEELFATAHKERQGAGAHIDVILDGGRWRWRLRSAHCCAQAQATQEANRAASNRWPPFWAIAAMLVLGFDEMLAVLYNPLWLILGLFLFLFGKTVYQV